MAGAKLQRTLHSVQVRLWASECLGIDGTPPTDVLLTTLAAFTIIFTLIRLVVGNFKESKDPWVVLIYEFYGQNPTSAYLMDLLFIIAYFAVALAIYHADIGNMGQSWMPSVRFIVILALVIVVLNMLIRGITTMMVDSNPNAHYIQFFHKWGNAMGFWAIVWDWFYLGLIALLAFTLIAFGLYNNMWVIAGFWLIVTYYFLTISE